MIILLYEIQIVTLASKLIRSSSLSWQYYNIGDAFMIFHDFIRLFYKAIFKHKNIIFRMSLSIILYSIFFSVFK